VERATFSDLVEGRRGGGVFEPSMRPGLADCAPSGRIRLDALARWLQDVAYADVEDAGLAGGVLWVLRRSRIRAERFPRFAERFEVRTFCSGLGRMWAERRTTITCRGACGGAPAVEAVALWVHLDPVQRRPAPVSPEEIATYGGGGPAVVRRVTARLRHPAPDGAREARRWRFRATECDMADHVNNAAYWEPIEEELLENGADPDWVDAEIEFRTPSQPGEKLVLAAGEQRWIVSPERETHASIALRTGTR
jgi:acyl-ACP thioesterase